jgi:hypothetical protein
LHVRGHEEDELAVKATSDNEVVYVTSRFDDRMEGLPKLKMIAGDESG